MGWSDKLNMNIQRMGRLNRRGKKVSFTNLYVLDKDSYPVFIDEDVANDLLRRLGLRGPNPIKLITSDKIAEWSNQIVLDNIPFEDVAEEVRNSISKEEEIVLRDIPKTFRYTSIETIQKRKKGKKIQAVRKTMTVDKKMNNIPWTYYDPCSEEDGERDLLYMPWMFEVDHPSGVNSNIWKIDSYDKESGIRYISPYDGPQYPLYTDDEEDNDESENNSSSSECTTEDYTDLSLDIKYYEEDKYHLECDPVYLGDYVKYGYSSLHTLEEIKRIISNLLQFSNSLSEKQKWSPFSNLNIIMRRANVVLDNVLSNYYIDDTDEIMKSVATLLNNNPELENDRLISVLFYIDKEEEKVYMKKSWLGLAKVVKQFIIEEIEKKVEKFDRSLLSISQTKYIVKEYDGNHIVRGVEYGDKLYLFSHYPDYFIDYIIENDLNIIEDVREESNGYSRKDYFPINDKTMNKLMWGTEDFIVGHYNVNSINKADTILNDLLAYCTKYGNTKSLDPFIMELHSTYLIADFFNTTPEGERYNSDMVVCTKISELHKGPDGNYYVAGKYLDGLNQVLRLGKTRDGEDGLGYNARWLSIHHSMKEFILNDCVKDIEEKYPYVEFDKFEFTYNVIEQDDYKDDIHEPLEVIYKDLKWVVPDDVKFEYTGDINYSSVRKEVVKRYVYGDGLYTKMCVTNFTKNKTKEILLKQGVKLLLENDGYEVHDVMDKLRKIHKEESSSWGNGVGYLLCEYAHSDHFKSHEGKILHRLYEETGATVKDILETVAYQRSHGEIQRIEGNYSWYHCLDRLLNESNISNDIRFNSYYLSLPYNIVEFVENVIEPDLKEKYGKDYYLRWDKLKDITGMVDGKPDMIIGMSYEVDKDTPWLKYYLDK